MLGAQQQQLQQRQGVLPGSISDTTAALNGLLKQLGGSMPALNEQQTQSLIAAFQSQQASGPQQQQQQHQQQQQLHSQWS